MAVRTTKQVKKSAYAVAWGRLFTKIQGLPLQKARKKLEGEAAAIVMEISVCVDCAVEFGLVAEVIEPVENISARLVMPTRNQFNQICMIPRLTRILATMSALRRPQYTRNYTRVGIFVK